MHGFRSGQSVFWHVRDAYFGMRGSVVEGSDYFDSPCLLVRFGRNCHHTQCSHLSSTDPKLTRQARRCRASLLQKRQPDQERAHQRRLRPGRRHVSTSSRHVASCVATETSAMEGLLCGHCGDPIAGTACCVAGEVCQLFSTPHHFGCLQFLRPNAPWEIYAFPEIDEADLTGMSATPSPKEQEKKVSSAQVQSPPSHMHHKPPKSCLDAWSPMIHRLGSAAKRKSRSAGFPFARSWRCVAKPRCGRTARSDGVPVVARSQVTAHSDSAPHGFSHVCASPEGVDNTSDEEGVDNTSDESCLVWHLMILTWLCEPVVLAAVYSLCFTRKNSLPLAVAALLMKWFQVHFTPTLCSIISAVFVELMLVGVPDGLSSWLELRTQANCAAHWMTLAAALHPSFPIANDQESYFEDEIAEDDDDDDAREGDDDYHKVADEDDDRDDGEQPAEDMEEDVHTPRNGGAETPQGVPGSREHDEEDDERRAASEHESNGGDTLTNDLQRVMDDNNGEAATSAERPVAIARRRRRPRAEAPEQQAQDAKPEPDAMENEALEMQQWLRAYKDKLQQATADPGILKKELPDMDFGFATADAANAHDSAGRGQAQGSAAIAIDDDLDEILQVWAPQGFQCGPGTELADLEFEKDEADVQGTMADEMDVFRARVDEEFEWSNKRLDAQVRLCRAAAQATLLLIEASPEDARSEILQAKIFTLLLGEHYRSHGEVLFLYQSGAFAPSPHNSISSSKLEFVHASLRRAQAYYMAMATLKPLRAFRDVAVHVKVLHSLPDEHVLMDWQLADIRGRKQDTKARLWLYGLTELCRELRKQFSEHNKQILKNFHRWAESDLTRCQVAGMAFIDAYISTAGGRIRQLRKDPRHGCYILVKHRLAYKPSDYSRKRLAALLFSSFAGGDGLERLLAQCALVLCRVRQPDVMNVFYGLGMEGKTLILVDLMRAVWGTGFGNPPGTVLQVDREFQQQGIKFLHCVMLCLDECRRDLGLVEDVAKLFIGNGVLPLRKNHEADTKDGTYEFAGKNWLMNIGDIPPIPTASETSHARRFRGTFMRARITADRSQVDVANRVFFAKADAKEFVTSGDAVWSFLHDHLFKYIRQKTPQHARRKLEHVTQGSMTEKDTTWLHRKMERSITTASPDEVESPEGPADTVTTKAEQLVRETHDKITDRYFQAHLVNRTIVASNPGQTRGTNAKLRSDYLKDAIHEFPYLIRLANSKDRFERRTLRLGDMEKTLHDVVAQEQVFEAFGGWSEWAWPETPASEEAWDDFCEGVEPHSLKAGPRRSFVFRIDTNGLQEYCRQGVDPRQDQVQQYVAYLENHAQKDSAGGRVSG